MTDTFTPSLIVAVAIAAVLGGAIGVALMLLIQRSQSGGKSLADLRQEQEDYQKAVEDHFQRTATLFKELSDNYVALYDHLASGAQQLCQGAPAITPPSLQRPQATADDVTEPVAQRKPGAEADQRSSSDSGAQPHSPMTPNPDAQIEGRAAKSPQGVVKTPEPNSE